MDDHLKMISVVIPTYNRPHQLGNVLQHIFMSETDGFKSVEVIVVDDGSRVPAREIVEAFRSLRPFRLKYLYQENTGPAGARNQGFKKSKHEIVLFIDDDILVFPDLIKRHWEAHKDLPGSVIFGQNPYAPPEEITPSYEYLEGLNEQGIAALPKGDSGYIRLDTIASGNISFERSMFSDAGEVYGRDLTIPAGEEFELALRLREKNIPIYLSPEIKGWHLQPATIIDSAQQNYKYGLGIAEVVAKKPEVLDFAPVRYIFEHNCRVRLSDSWNLKLKKSVRRAIAPESTRRIALRIAVLLESILPAPRVLHPIYRLVVSVYFFAGLRKGIKVFREIKGD